MFNNIYNGHPYHPILQCRFIARLNIVFYILLSVTFFKISIIIDLLFTYYLRESIVINQHGVNKIDL